MYSLDVRPKRVGHPWSSAGRCLSAAPPPIRFISIHFNFRSRYVGSLPLLVRTFSSSPQLQCPPKVESPSPASPQLKSSSHVDSPVPASPLFQFQSPPIQTAVANALEFAECAEGAEEGFEEEAAMSNSASENEAALSGSMDNDLKGLSPGSKKALAAQFKKLRESQDGLHFVRFGILLGGRGPAWVLHC